MIPKLQFGRTGHQSTRTIFGAAALGRVDQAQADRTLEVLLQYGVNHIDTAASYGDSELRVGPWMKQYRNNFFLATKTGERTYEKAREQIHRSLERLQVDHVDLLQLHNLVDAVEWENTLRPGGAIEAALEAKEQGLVRFIGVTGHGLSAPAVHKRSLLRHDFDTVLCPYNFITIQNEKYAADFEALQALCQERNVAFQTIKAIAREGWPADKPKTRTTWYEPLEEQDEIDIAVHWVLSRPGIFLNTVGDVNLLPKVLDAANRFEQAAPREELDKQIAGLHFSPLFV